MFPRLTKEKVTLAREIDQEKNVKNSWNFAWLEENVSVLVSWKRKTVEHSVRVGNYIEKIDLPQKAHCYQYTFMVSYGSSGKKGLL